MTDYGNSRPPKKSATAQTSFTLRFKHHRTTILLLCQPTSPFSTIRSDLLSILKSVHPNGLNDAQLPASAEDIILGAPLDRNDLRKGWTSLEIPEFDEEELAKGAKGVKKGSVFNQTPLGAGLKDGAVLAFKFSADDERESDEMDLERDDWDVVLPSLDDDGSRG